MLCKTDTVQTHPDGLLDQVLGFEEIVLGVFAVAVEINSQKGLLICPVC